MNEISNQNWFSKMGAGAGDKKKDPHQIKTKILPTGWFPIVSDTLTSFILVCTYALRMDHVYIYGKKMIPEARLSIY